MNQSITTSNLALTEAYHNFQDNQIEQALDNYKIALKNTFSEELKANIKCTMAVIEQSLGNY